MKQYSIIKVLISVSASIDDTNTFREERGDCQNQTALINIELTKPWIAYIGCYNMWTMK